MKDAGGHGSNPRGAAAHQSSVNDVARIKVNPAATAAIKQNPSGFSVHPGTGRSPTSGYMVAQPGRTQLLNAGELSADHVAQFVTKNADVFQRPDMHIGGWTKGGKMYLDPSENIHDLDVAVAAGRARNQIAIWDVKNKREIQTGGTGR